MQIFETNAIVDDQGNLVITVPTNMSQGEHHAVVVLGVPLKQVEKQIEQPKEEPERLTTWPPPGFKVFNATLTDPQNTLRREDLYDTNRG